MSGFLSDLDLLTSEQKKEQQRHLLLYISYQFPVGLVRIFSNTRTIIYLILTYNFSELNPHILFYVFYFSTHHDIC